MYVHNYDQRKKPTKHWRLFMSSIQHFCRFWWFGHWFFISLLILNCYNISITPNTCISFIHRVRLYCTCKSTRKHAKYISTGLSNWDFATPHNLCWRYEMFQKFESSDRGSGQHVRGHLEYCEKTKVFFKFLGLLTSKPKV